MLERIKVEYIRSTKFAFCAIVLFYFTLSYIWLICSFLNISKIIIIFIKEKVIRIVFPWFPSNLFIVSQINLIFLKHCGSITCFLDVHNSYNMSCRVPHGTEKNFMYFFGNLLGTYIWKINKFFFILVYIFCEIGKAWKRFSAENWIWISVFPIS